MIQKGRLFSLSLDTTIAVLIALASLATALAAWRTNTVNSQASNISREGLISAIKSSSLDGETWRKVYEEAGYARNYLEELAAVEALEASGGALNSTIASNLRQYLLTGMLTLAEPLGTALEYRQADGSFDLQKRYQDLQKADKDLGMLAPETAFKITAQFHQQQRLLTIGLVLLAASLFWLGMAEISPGRTKIIALVIGVLFFVGTLGYFAIIETLFALIRGGLQ